jgi:HEAT repeat protein
VSGRRPRVLIAHADGEDARAAELAGPLGEAGYEVVHNGTLLVGESLAQEASRVLAEGGPVVVCGTVHAIGTGWVHRLVTAARAHARCAVLPVRMERGAHLELLDWGCVIAEHWRDPSGAVRGICAALAKLHPDPEAMATITPQDAEQRYRSLLLDNYDIYEWNGLPLRDTHLTTTKMELRRLYVALRVIVESSPDTGLDQDRLTAIQFEREQQRGMWSFQRPADDERIPKAQVPIGERLSASRRLVVLGDPGSGKSTLLKWLATAYLLRFTHDPEWDDLPDARTLPDEDLLPVLVRCRELEHEQIQGTFESVLRRTLHKLVLDGEASQRVLDVVLNRLTRGRALLLIDGLDEINDPRARAVFCELLERVHVAYPAAMVVVTSRIVGYREMSRRIGRGFEHVRMADFDRADKEAFARHWCDLTEPPARVETAVSGLVSDMHSSDRIERLTGNPLLLTTMAIVRRYLGRLPNRRGDLYAEAVEVLLNWRSDVGEPLTRTEALPQLEYIAFTMCRLRTQQLRLDELIDLCAQMRAEFPNIHAAKQHEPEEFIRLVEQRTGLLSETGYVRHEGQLVGVFEFRHLTFQEYLAGLALARGHFPGHQPGRSLASTVRAIAVPVWSPRRERDDVDDDDDVDGRMGVPENWLEPIRLCATACKSSDVDAVLTAVLAQPPEEDAAATRRPRAVLAALCLADEPDVGRPVARQIIGALVEGAEDRDGERWSPTDLVEAAMELAGSTWRDELKEMLVRAYVNLQPAERRPVGAVFGRVAAHVRGRNVDAGVQAAELRDQLEGADHSLAIEAALRVGASVQDYQLSCAYRDAAITHRLIPLCGRQSAVADAAAWALARILPQSVRRRNWNPTLTYFSNGPYFTKAHLRAIEKLLLGQDEPGAGVLVSLYAIASCARLRRSRSRARATARHADGAVRAASIRLLGALEDQGSLALIARALTDTDPRVRAAAAAALGWLDETASAAALEAALADPAREVRAAAAIALRSLPAPATPARYRALSDPDGLVRASPLEMPYRPVEEPAVDLIVPLLQDLDVRVRRAAARVLGAHEDIAAVPALVSCLDDRDQKVRANAARGLAYVRDLPDRPELVERIHRALSDTSGDVRSGVIDTLQHRADDGLVSSLRDRLADNQPSVRAGALTVLGRLGAVSEADVVAHLSSDDHRVVGAALDALLGMGGVDIVDRLVDACRTRPSRALFQAVVGRHIQDGPSSVENLRCADLTETLASYRAGGDRDLRAGALLARAAFGDEDCVEELCSSCARSIDDDVAHLARVQTGPAAVRMLRRLAAHDSAWVRYNVLRRLVELREPGWLAPLATLMADHDPSIRTQVGHGLDDVPESDEVAHLLLRGLGDAVSSVREAAAWALGDCRSDAVTDALLRHVHDPSRRVRAAVLVGLGGRSPEVVTPPLLEALEHDPFIRRNVAWALGRTVQSPSLTSRIVAQLRGDDPEDRYVALGALPLAHRPDLSDLAVARLEDDDVRVRQRACAALWEVRHEAAGEHLRALLGSADPRERRRAVGMLAEDRDEVDRRLLTAELTGRYEWRDPRWPVTPAWARIAAWRLVLPDVEVQRRYEALAGDFALDLAWP